ncbi:MAG: UDP-N-acetylglucosamine--N-acetylmuramyl-(pentapeptide) pyrophosphoryl-undecaprenol N-acetylglucosamine transferase [Candidatus Pelagibacter sp.]|mgnify:CR=1 FL=1|nr:UDP-N-acetylglucosamine--N-acetylmuramyl-(pentapeptide) pyrophosphoryl-undecaprenol N-acetylglucosamine transferase [Candidatus Pelagibacter sp.]|tara:strand:- start:16084 stop:17181 length:1098 start_codon:yes stop_codon:yes gene_type:complete
MKDSMNKIIIATGGTGGHIFPSLSLANYLKEKYEIELTTDKRGFFYLKNFKKYKVTVINSDTIFGKNIFKVFLGTIKIISSLIFSIFLILKIKPKLIIGMGGYSSFPICLAGYLLRIPIIIYENNLVLGRANKLLLPLARKILVSCKEVKGVNLKNYKKISFCGYLIRDEILNLRKYSEEISSKKDLSVLIMGGSQSAKIFGEILPGIIVKCFQKGINLKIYQQCLEEQIGPIKEIYEKFKIKFELFSFSGKISKYYRQADLAITRSGASSLAELINLRIPFIAIPLPSSADNHQFENANYFYKKGYCILLEQRFISNRLFEILLNLNKNEKKLLLMREKMKEHSDKNSFLQIEKLIKEILYEKI